MTRRLALWALVAIGAVAPASAVVPKPKPGPLQVYRDWTIGCDNGGRCEAVSLLPENADFGQANVNIIIVRDAGPDSAVELWLRQAGGELGGAVSLLVDGRKVASARITSDEGRILGPQAAAITLAIARGNSMEIRQGNRVVARPSLAGSAAALRYMDAQQGRAGTTTALIAAGPMEASAVKAAPALPSVRRAAVFAGVKAVALWREELSRAAAQAGCSDEVDGTREAEQYPLSKTQTIVLIPCGMGAYNYSTVPMIATGVVGRRQFTPARFDFQPGWSDDPAMPMLVNASWDAARAQLGSYAKGRGIGDCGGSETFVWDGTLFRLTEAKAMGECRGAWHWITTWRARVVQ